MSVTRRSFLARTVGCSAYLAAGMAGLPVTVRRTFAATPSRPVVAEEDFARIERMADGVWAVVSTPLKDGGRHFETTANGGIVAGRDGVLVIEGYYTDEGAAWVAARARELTGREPTHVVVTHYHADHTRGLGGLDRDRADSTGEPVRLTTPTTRKRLAAEEEPVLPDAGIGEQGQALEIDLGGRRVRLTPRRGHTSSDVTVHLDEPDVVWCGDLVWNGMFPNYVDAIPSALTRHCSEILDRRSAVFVPGHGDVGTAGTLAPYRSLVLDLESAARRAVEQGTPAEQAAAAYELPDSIREWVMFSEDYVERAFTAWERELVGGPVSGTTRR